MASTVPLAIDSPIMSTGMPSGMAPSLASAKPTVGPGDRTRMPRSSRSEAIFLPVVKMLKGGAT